MRKSLVSNTGEVVNIIECDENYKAPGGLSFGPDEAEIGDTFADGILTPTPKPEPSPPPVQEDEANRIFNLIKDKIDAKVSEKVNIELAKKGLS